MQTEKNKIIEKDKFKFERKEADFPFYNNIPHLSKIRWAILSIGLIATCAIVLIPESIIPFSKNLLYFLIPFITFGIVANWKFNLICKKFKRNDIKTILIIIFLSFIYSIIIAMLLNAIGIPHSPNPIDSQLGNITTWIMFPFQIFGEELIKLLTLILSLTILYKITNKRKESIMISTLICAIIFGILHIPAYNNAIYAILTIGIGDIIIIYGYLKTKNIFVPYVAHIAYDLIATILPFLLT